MKRTMLLCAALAGLAAIQAEAVDLPVREPVGITNTTASALSVPDFQGNGQLQRLQVIDDYLTNNTVTVRHVIRISAARSVTNTVAALAYTTTPGVSLVVTNGPYLFAGDRLTYTFGTSSTGTVISVRTLAK